jgi:hypothetical protein
MSGCQIFSAQEAEKNALLQKHEGHFHLTVAISLS